MPSGSYFIITGDASHYTGSRVVGASTLSLPYEVFSWASVDDRVRGWAGEVKLDVETPDLWEDLQRERELLNGNRFEALENTLFDPSEQAEIAQTIREIKEYVRETYSLSPEQMLHVEARFDDAEAAARRIGRKDWVLLLCGVMSRSSSQVCCPPTAFGTSSRWQSTA